MPTITTRGAIAAMGFGFGAQTVVSGNNYTWVFLNNGGSASSFTVPTGVTSLTVEAIGGGGAPSSTGGAGGGGAYAKSLITVTPGQTVYYYVGYGGASDSWLNKSANSAPGTSSDGVLAAGGGIGSGTTGGNGGSVVSSIGQTKYAGGKGGNKGSVAYAAGGGGGAGGPFGTGGDGGNGTSSGTAAGGGGGGAGGASTTAGSTATSGVGGNGGIGPTGTAGGTGANGTTTAATVGANGSGGGGGATGTSPYSAGKLSASYDYWGAGYGPGGGTGGASVNNQAYGGATFGAGGAGNLTGSTGGAGAVAVTFNLATPSAYQTVTLGKSYQGGNTIPQSYLAGVDSSGNVYTGLNSSGVFSGLAKISSTGAVIWQRQFDTSNDFQLQSAICDSSFNIYIGGVVGSTGANVIAKYNSSGVLQWQKQFVYAGNTISIGNLSVDSSNNVWMTGVNVTGNKFVLHKLTSSGGYTNSYYFTPIAASAGFNTGANWCSATADSSGGIYISWSETWNPSCCVYYNYTYLCKLDTSAVVQWTAKDSNSGGGSSGNYTPYQIGITTDSSSNVYWGVYTLNGYAGFRKIASSGGSVTWSYNIAFAPVNPSVSGITLDSSNNLYASLWDNVNNKLGMIKLNSSGVRQYYKTITGFYYTNPNPYVQSTTLYQGFQDTFYGSYWQVPTAGLTAGNYGNITIADYAPSTNTSNYTSVGSSNPSISPVTFTVTSSSYTDAASSLTSLVGWL